MSAGGRVCLPPSLTLASLLVPVLREALGVGSYAQETEIGLLSLRKVQPNFSYAARSHNLLQAPANTLAKSKTLQIAIGMHNPIVVNALVDAEGSLHDRDTGIERLSGLRNRSFV